jgi:hypothetical protein
MTCRTRPRPDRGGVTDPPICRRLFSIKQAADFAGVQVSEICHWIESRGLEAYVLNGQVRLDEVELANWLLSPDCRRP